MAAGTKSPFTSVTVPLMFAGSGFEAAVFELSGVVPMSSLTIGPLALSDWGLGASGREDEDASCCALSPQDEVITAATTATMTGTMEEQFHLAALCIKGLLAC